jgi:Domain of unknown function (DUF4126)
MDLLQSVALAGGMAWGSGIRLYAVVFAAGLLGRLGYLDLPVAMQVIENPWVMGVAGFMLTMEFIADKFPAVDTLWDSIHTFIRVPAGAMLAALAMGDHDPAVMAVAGLLGGTIALGTHAAKAGSRALINTSPEPFSNITASFSEDALVTGGLYAAIFHPAVFLVLLVVFLVLLIWVIPKVFRGIRLVWGRINGNTKMQI